MPTCSTYPTSSLDYGTDDFASAISQFRGTYRFLSNFYHSPFTYKGIRYPTVEHAYHAAKTSNVDHKHWIAESSTPSQAKQRGKQVCLVPNWNKNRDHVMLKLLTLKFGSITDLSRELKAKLIRTSPLLLIEGNCWDDTYWGMCQDESGQWQGHNKLGTLLMQVRHQLSSDDLTTTSKGKVTLTKDRIVADMIQHVQSFTSGPFHTHWLEVDSVFKVYVRKGNHYIHRQNCECLDIANVEVAEKWRSKGIFSDFLSKVATISPYPYLYMESVINPRLKKFLQRHPSWIEIVPRNGSRDNNFYLCVEANNNSPLISNSN
jgi:ribA/ribD-fused uncharacterized protein